MYKRQLIGITGAPVGCSHVGDLPILARDIHNEIHELTLRNVHYVPASHYTIVSVRELNKGNAAVEFDDRKRIALSSGTVFEFGLEEGVFVWQVARLRDGYTATDVPPGRAAPLYENGPTGHNLAARSLVPDGAAISDDQASSSSIHAAGATAYVSNLRSDAAAYNLYRRFHIGLQAMQQLHTFVADAPANIASATYLTAASNDPPQVPILTTTWCSSHCGRLVHGEVLGPFPPSAVGGHRWLIILVDDHSRWRKSYSLATHSGAGTIVRRFISELMALTSVTKTDASRPQGALVAGASGPSLSYLFKESLDEAAVDSLGVPKYNQPLNAVAEYEVRQIMRLLFLDMGDSGAPASFWSYAAAHACDVLNNTSRPSGCTKSSTELVTGSQPKIMRILPFGCKIYALIPAQRVGKTNPARSRS